MKYFSLDEFTKSKEAEKRGIKNLPTSEDIANITRLVDVVLDPLREAYGKPIVVSSGYRCDKLNKAVGGDKNSHHLFGMAADMHGTPNDKQENRRLFNLVRELNLPFTQLINEYDYTWVHISYDKDDIRKEVLATTNGVEYVRV